VQPFIVPTVTVNAAPAFSINTGDEVTFTATVANAGSTPTYQWFINSVAVAGATNATFVHTGFANLDTVTCRVVSSGVCSGIVGSKREVMYVNNVGIQNIATLNGKFMLLPNPNTGNFILMGSLHSAGNTKVDIQVTDMLGKVVENINAIAADGVVNIPIQLPQHLANGMYSLSITYGNSHQVIHFVVRK
jgi:hypothetical protein